MTGKDKDNTSSSELLQGWSRLTTRLLLPTTGSSSSLSSSSSAGAASCSAWAVLDAPLGDADDHDGWAASLSAEWGMTLRTHGKRARTTGDAQTDRIWQILSQQGFLSTLTTAEAAMNSGLPSANAAKVMNTSKEKFRNDGNKSQSSSRSNNTRGDTSLFVSREMRRRSDFGTRYPRLARYIEVVHSTVAHHLSVQQKHRGSSDTDNDGAKIRYSYEFDFSQTSVQLAEYPGDGMAGYPRHCDRSSSSSSSSSAQCPGPDELEQTKYQRLLTVVYYLTPDDWDAVADQGALRIFHDTTTDTTTTTNNNSPAPYTDIYPYSDRMVIFRSDLVEHQVLPSQKRPRRALTLWLYGRVVVQSHKETMGSPALPTDPTPVTRSPTVPISMTNVNTNQSEGVTKLDVSTIFVSIASFRDSETAVTIQNLYDKARYPERVFVGLVLQVNEQEDKYAVLDQLPTHLAWYRSNVRVLRMDARDATGPCPARAMAQLLHRGEDHVLQIDAHMRFCIHWDAYLLQEWLACASPKSLLSTYPAGYHLPNDVPYHETRGTRLYAWKFDDTDGMLRQKARFLTTAEQTQTTPPRTNLFAAGFCFGPSSWIRDCPYDGTLHHLFFGEEMSLAVRLYTCGYDLYAPRRAVCFHLWTRAHRPPSNPVCPATRETSLRVVQAQLAGEQGRGLGTVRSAADWAAAVGIDLRRRMVLEGSALTNNDMGVERGDDGIVP